MNWRNPASGKATNKRFHTGLPALLPTQAMGGGGMWASPTEYLKLLQAILKNAGTLLTKETVEDMFKPHLSVKSARNDESSVGT